MPSLFDTVGGQPAVDAAVDIFYKKVLEDPSISKYFTSIEMDGQRKKQKAFFTTIFKGDTAGADSYMRKAHEKLVRNDGLNDQHFDAVAGHLQATLNELGLKSDLVSTIMGAAGGLRNSVLCR
jgi:hemoglobin